ncbi:mediator complex subunit NUT2 [Aspergillus lucknowensis]|uniref:Mediator of RNA polymerase II transcription subunit 10 n=1 Tax=Aspergillus lucknowensis TaxID=176173 RepID=A0ABR4LQ65_9EURO
MAPVTLSTVDDEIKDIIQHLFEIQSAVHGYLGPETQRELVRKMYRNLPPLFYKPLFAYLYLFIYFFLPCYLGRLISPFANNSKTLTTSLHTLSLHTRDETDPSSVTIPNPENPADPPIASIALPPEIIDYVDAARNPDIYTREFVELVQRGNQDLKGKKEAFASFRDVLAREMRGAMPEVRGEVEKVIRATGGERS